MLNFVKKKKKKNYEGHHPVRSILVCQLWSRVRYVDPLTPVKLVTICLPERLAGFVSPKHLER